MLNTSDMQHGFTCLADKPGLLTSSPNKLIFFFFFSSLFHPGFPFPRVGKGVWEIYLSAMSPDSMCWALQSDLLCMAKLYVSWKL